MQFGKKFDRNSAEKESSTDVSGLGIWGFQSGSTIIRLLDDLEDWTEYWEHYDANLKKYFPCSGRNEGCAGCAQDLKSSHKWLANAYVVASDSDKTKPGYVNLFKFPKSIMTKVMRHNDKRGTLLHDEYEIIRLGQGMDTEYDLERGDSPQFDMEMFLPQAVNHEDALLNAYEEYMTVFSGQAPKAAPVERTRVEPVRPADRVQVARVDAGEPPFSAPQAPAAVAEVPEEDDEEVLSEDDILAMEFADLVSLAKRAGLDVPEDFVDAEETARWLITTLGE